MKKKLIRALAAAAALTVLLSACTPGGDASSGSASSSGSGASSTEPAPQPVKPAEPAPIDFTWNPKPYSDYLRRGRGPEMEQFFYDCVDALMHDEASVPCYSEEAYWELTPFLSANFPVAGELISDSHYQDGEVSFEYRHSAEERAKILKEFGEQIERHVEGAVREGDTSTMAAIALYHSFSKGLTYDYEALETFGEDVRPYRALMTGEGICQSFGPAYAYLCMEMGINAVEAGGLSSDLSNAHSWTMLELNGRHYFADPTFEENAGGEGLYYFGMDADQRARDGYLFKDVTMGFNLMYAKEFQVDDDLFAPLWDVTQIRELRRTEAGMEIRCASNRREQSLIPIEDGKYLIVIPDNQPTEDWDEYPGVAYEALAGTAWRAPGMDLAFLEDGTVWVDSTDYVGLARCRADASEQLTLLLPDTEFQLQLERDTKMALTGPCGLFYAEKQSKSEFTRLLEQMDQNLQQGPVG